MFALPILRKPSDLEFPADCPNPPCGPAVGFASPLAQMSGNHFTCGVATNWIDLIGWGAQAYLANTLGFVGSTNKPNKASINRANDIVLGLPEKSKIIKVRSYAYYTFILTEKGFLYASGYNYDGIFNTGSSGESRSTFELVTRDVRDFDIGSGGSSWESGPGYILVLKKDGKVYGAGGNYKGYGVGASQTNYTSLQYLNIDNVKKVICTGSYSKGKSLAIKNDGTVWACGYNDYGCLGVNSADAIVYTWQKVQKRDTIGGSISDLTNVIDAIATNWVFIGGANASAVTWQGGTDWMNCYFLTSDGFVYTSGNNKFGQLGLGQAVGFTTNVATKTSITNASKISTTAGGSSIAVATTNNELYTWGNNQWGQLGLGNQTNTATPTKATLTFTDLIMDINGGGHYGIINGAFVILTGIGEVHSAGFNETYALGITVGGVAAPGPITTFTKNEYFGPNPTQIQDPANPTQKLIAKAVDLCGYGTEMSQKTIITENGVLYMSGWNQNVDGIWNFNPNVGTQNVLVPTKYVLSP